MATYDGPHNAFDAAYADVVWGGLSGESQQTERHRPPRPKMVLSKRKDFVNELTNETKHIIQQKMLKVEMTYAML
eukprot:4306586-Amphidinium_carterae.1